MSGSDELCRLPLVLKVRTITQMRKTQRTERYTVKGEPLALWSDNDSGLNGVINGDRDLRLN